MAQLLHDLITDSAWKTPGGLALRYADNSLNYAELADCVDAIAQGLLALDLGRGERVAVFLEKREEAVLAMFGASAAGLAFVPVNPLLKPEQVAHILRDSGTRVLVTSPARLSTLDLVLARCPDLRYVLQTGDEAGALAGLSILSWNACMDQRASRDAHRCIESDMAAILYTSGASGLPKGVVLSHRNLVAGAHSVVQYLDNSAQDRILAALPLCSAYGLSQLTTAFASGAAAVLLNQLLTRDILDAVEREHITGLAAVPSTWIQLAELNWHERHALRYLTSAGDAMPRATLDTLRRRLPRTRVYLMYGLTEAFRSTYLAPEQLDRRPDSIGKAVPNAEVLVLDAGGQPCVAGQAGELVQRGPLVALGYWNGAGEGSERFRPLPPGAGLPAGETALWSGDTVRMDEEGYLYFIGRSDDMIKSGGYRVSPTEVEAIVEATGLVAEAAAFGIAHPVLGQTVALAARAHAGCELTPAVLMAACRAKLPAYMLPTRIEIRATALPRDAAGQVERRGLAREAAAHDAAARAPLAEALP